MNETYDSIEKKRCHFEISIIFSPSKELFLSIINNFCSPKIMESKY